MQTIKLYARCHFWFIGAVLAFAACSSATEDDPADSAPQVCQLKDGENPDFTQLIGCQADFDQVAALPMDSSLPLARSVKTVIDQLDQDALYFQNSNTYQIHWEFVSKHLSGNGKPIVPALAQFNETEYYSPSRRFLLGAVTYYAGPKVWAYEISPYDTSNAEMIAKAYLAIRGAAFFGKQLYFHPTSAAVEAVAKDLPANVSVITTDELYAGTSYQALNLGTSYGRLRFITKAQLETEYVTFRDIVVLDEVPNDISVVMGIITQEFQTPLSHVNVLSQNRGTPNMGLKGAFTDEKLLALKDKWVRLEVKAFEYEVSEVSVEEADQWWEEHKPTAVSVPRLDDTVKDLRDVEEIIDPQLPLKDAIKAGIPAFGGKASHFGALARIPKDVPVPKAFAIPVYYYMQFMEQNGFGSRVDQLLEDADFNSDPSVRDVKLKQLREDMMKAPVDATFLAALKEKLTKEYPAVRMRFRSSTNAEDLDGFTGAGLYTSKSGDLSDPNYPIEDAIREVWSSVWYFRAFEERSYRSIDHKAVGMALLVHHSFPDEEANGVALTANPFDTSGLEPGFYINVQVGEASVVQPDAGITTDQFIYQYDMPGQPIVFIAHSNLVPEGQSVLTTAQTYQLGKALTAIHSYFKEAYGPPSTDPNAWYAMDTEFKFDGEPGEEPALYVKQARPHPGRGQ